MLFRSYSLKSGSLIPPALLFSLKTALAILGLLWLPINFRIISSVKNVMGILIGTTLIFRLLWVVWPFFKIGV